MRTSQHSFNAGEVTPSLYGRVDLEKFETAVATMRNFIAMPQGGATRRPGTMHVAAAKYSGKRSRLIPFIFSVTQAYIIELGEDAAGNGYMRFYMDGGQILSGASPYELVDGSGGVVIPWTAAELDEIQYFQSADKLWLCHPNWATREITRTGHTAWTISAISIGTSVSTPATPAASVVGTPATTTYSYKVTAVLADTYEESLPTAAFGVETGPAVLNTTDYIQLSWAAVAGASHYNIYKSYAGSYGYLGRAETSPFKDFGGYTPNVNDTPPTDRDPFSGAGNYPRAGCYHQQRMSFGGSDNGPQTVWLSQVGNFWNFNRSFPLRDDDACQFTLDANQVNIVRWMVSAGALLIGTAGGEWSLRSGSGSTGITPTAVDSRQESTHGSNAVQPAVAGSVTLFVQRGGRRLRELVYSWESDGYETADLSVLAEHMTFNYGITQMAWQQSPHQVLWCVREDGELLALTYMREHKVLAWHRHDLGGSGAVESVACIPQSDGGEDELWLIVNRTIDGSTARYIERMAPSFVSDDVEDATFLDSFLTYHDTADITAITQADPAVVTATAHGFSTADVVKIDDVAGMTELNGRSFSITVIDPDTFSLDDEDSSAYTAYVSGGIAAVKATTISGLDHLEGATVSILADGSPMAERVVASGEITLDRASALVHVGLPYFSDIQTLPLVIDEKARGLSVGRAMRVTRAMIRLYRSQGLNAGTDFDASMRELPWRSSGDVMGAPLPLFSGIVEADIDSEIEQVQQICLRQAAPLPCTILSITPELEAY